MTLKKFIPDIQRLSRKFNEPHLFLNIIKSIKKGESFPYGDGDALFILKPTVINSQKTMFVWLGIHHKNEKLAADIQHLEIMAILSRCTHVRFESKRAGFKRYAPKFGYLHVGVRDNYDIYEKKVA